MLERYKFSIDRPTLVYKILVDFLNEPNSGMIAKIYNESEQSPEIALIKLKQLAENNGFASQFEESITKADVIIKILPKLAEIIQDKTEAEIFHGGTGAKQFIILVNFLKTLTSEKLSAELLSLDYKETAKNTHPADSDLEWASLLCRAIIYVDLEIIRALVEAKAKIPPIGNFYRDMAAVDYQPLADILTTLEENPSDPINWEQHQAEYKNYKIKAWQRELEMVLPMMRDKDKGDSLVGEVRKLISLLPLEKQSQYFDELDKNISHDVDVKFMDSRQYHHLVLSQVGKGLLFAYFSPNYYTKRILTRYYGVNETFFAEIGSKYIDKINGNEIELGNDILVKFSYLMDVIYYGNNNEHVTNFFKKSQTHYTQTALNNAANTLNEMLGSRESSLDLFKFYSALHLIVKHLISSININEQNSFDDESLIGNISHYAAFINKINDVIKTVELYFNFINRDLMLPNKKYIFKEGRVITEDYLGNMERLIDYIEKNILVTYLGKSVTEFIDEEILTNNLITEAINKNFITEEDAVLLRQHFNINTEVICPL